MKLMNIKLSLFKILGVIIPFFSISCSVSVPDQEYLDAQGGFARGDYPSEKILGHWFMYSTTYLSYKSTGSENRSDYLLQDGGRGTVRETTQYHQGDFSQDPGDGLIVLSAPIRWSKVGANIWRIDIPDSSSFRVERTNGPVISGVQTAHSFRVRYYNGRLYNIDDMKTLVPLSDAKRKIDRERNNIRSGITTPFVISY